jgi:UDP-3-O-[3-hydroxymyristoyl] glucosamine N-acyltransferase
MITGVAGIQEAKEGEITFLSNRKYRRYLQGSRASAVIMTEEMFDEKVPIPAILSENPYYTFAKALSLFFQDERQSFKMGIHPTAIVHERASVGKEVSIGPYAVIREGTEVGDRVIIDANVVIGCYCQIGQETLIYPHVTLYDYTTIGARVIIHAGAVIGSDGFGFARNNGRYSKIPQVGQVLLEDDVEIGANTTIDRGTMGVTRIAQGTKIDNLVQIAHNVTVGRNTVIAAQVGVGGSTHIGDDVQIGGQAGLVGHIEIGDGVGIGAQAGVTKSFPDRVMITGYPARPLGVVRRSDAAQHHLPELLKTVREQEKRIAVLEEMVHRLHERKEKNA